MRPSNLVRLWFVFALNYSVLEASPSFMSNMNYNMYKYDQTVQQFTPDGRLLQIEYAMQAAQHSTPVVLVPLSEKLLLIVTTRRCPRAIKSSSTTTLSSSYLLQERLVLVPTGRLAGTTADAATHLQQQSPQQHAEMVVVALSGVLSDCLSLLEAVQDDRFERQRTFGSDSGSSNAMMVARTIADKCQSHAFGGGVRPFGATLLVCGIQPLTAATKATSHSQENDKDDHCIALYRTDPSGSIQEYSNASLSGNSSSAQQVVIVGGSVALWWHQITRPRTVRRRPQHHVQNDEIVHDQCTRCTECLLATRSTCHGYLACAPQGTTVDEDSSHCSRFVFISTTHAFCRSAGGGGEHQPIPEEVLVFIVGGVTYEEGTKIAEFNQANRSIKVVLAGSTVHNSTSFLDELRSTSL